jgi:DNA-binding XRE family transcriptional regulator
MKPAQYKAAREALGWTHAKLAETIGVSERTPFRYAAGEVEVPEPAARLLRLLVLLRPLSPLQMSKATEAKGQLMGMLR